MVNASTATVVYPCFSQSGLAGGALLLHLSTVCNMSCRYCPRGPRADGHEHGEGIGREVLTADAVAELVDRAMKRAAPRGIEIGGPGEPLLNMAAFTVLRRLHAAYPGLPLTVWTNGIILSDRLGDLLRAGARRIVLSLCAASHDTAARIYDRVIYRGRRHDGADAARIILQQQWNGLEQAVETGFDVTVHIVSIPGVNGQEIEAVSSLAAKIGAERVVVVPFEAGTNSG